MTENTTAALAQTPIVRLVEVPPDPNAPAVERSLAAVPNLSRESAQAAGQALLNSGMPLAEVQKHLAAEGYPNFGVETRDAATITRHTIANHLAPAAPKPDEYRGISYRHNSRADGLDDNQIAEFDGMAREWGAAAQLPPAVAADLVEQAIDWARQTDGLSESDATARQLSHEQRISYFAGRRGCTPEKMVEKARAVLSKGAFGNRLSAGGALTNAFIVTILADHHDALETATKLRTGG